MVTNVAIANSGAAYAFSRSGLLAYASGYLRGSGRELLRLVRVSLNGDIQPLPLDEGTFGRFVRISPDGRRLLVIGWDSSVWIYDLTRNSRIKLPTPGLMGADYPCWSPDGQLISYASERAGETGYKIFLQKADGTGLPQILVGETLNEKHPPVGISAFDLARLLRAGAGRSVIAYLSSVAALDVGPTGEGRSSAAAEASEPAEPEGEPYVMPYPVGGYPAYASAPYGLGRIPLHRHFGFHRMGPLSPRVPPRSFPLPRARGRIPRPQFP